jgi:hypothetical protein
MDGHGSGMAILGATLRSDARCSRRPTLSPGTLGSRRRCFLPARSTVARHPQQHLTALALVRRRLVLRHQRLFAHVPRLQ